MNIKLPAFEGRVPAAALVKLTGGADDRVGALNIGEEVFFVVKATVVGVTHGDVKDTFTRQHKVQATRLVLVEREDGERILAEATAMADDRFGVANLFADASSALGYDSETGEMDEQ